MPSAVATNRSSHAPDELDDLFNYDAGMDEIMNGTSAPDHATEPTKTYQDDTINLDEEVKVTRKRAPIAKLDEERLLSKGGIPKLRKISKQLRFKGKGHEFSDMARLLNTYQLWLDDLFPKAKFADGLTMIEKVGHKKQLQMMRREWINEGKPRPAEELDEVEVDDEPAAGPVSEQAARDGSGPSPADLESTVQADQTSRSDEVGQAPAEPDEDELDALLAESEPAQKGYTSLFGSGSDQAPAVQAPHRTDFEDEEEAMAGMDW
ncbi:hypothetical protein MBLNU457_4957t1 [Dothideomycetes sp. NU457]